MTEELERKLAESWIHNAEAWTTAVRKGRIESRRAVTDQAILDAVLTCGGSRVLDVGCGEGWLARSLSGHGLEVVGFDGCARLVERARELGGGTFGVLSYSELAEDPKEVGEKFDVVVSNFSLLGKSIGKLLRALTQVTTARGRLVVQTAHPATMKERPHEDGWREETFDPLAPLKFSRMPWFFRTVDSWRSALRDGGWRIIEIREPVDARTEMAASLILFAEQR